MKRFIIEQFSADIISHSGLSLIGQAIHSFQQSVGCQRLDATWDQALGCHQKLPGPAEYR